MFHNSHHGSRFHPRRAATATAAALAFAFAAAAFAQPYGPGGPHHGMGPGGPRGMGPGGDEMVGQLITRARAQLNLNTSQAGMFDAAVAQSKSARDTARSLHQKVHDTLAAELAKPEPDLAAVAAASDSVRDQAASLHKQVRASWLALYATFSPEQKAVVKDLMQKRMARMDAWRERMQQGAAAQGS